MAQNRREFLNIMAGSVATGILASTPLALAGSKAKTRAILFDAFPIFDPRPVFALVEELFPTKGAELSAAWRTRQFEYTWLRTVGHHYEDFWKVTEDALVFAAKTLKLELTPAKRTQLMDAYLGLKAYPDVLPTLRSLKEAGIRLGFLSNLTPQMLTSGIKNSGLDGLFEQVLSTDAVKTFKPDPRAYQLGIDAFGLKRDEFVFAAFASWDAVGAKWFGYKTFWVNRANQVGEELAVAPDGVGKGLGELATFVKS